MKKTGFRNRPFLLGCKIFIKVLLLLPILFAMIWFNFTVDRSGLFQGDRFEREMSLQLLAGKNIAGYEQLDERQINALYVQNMEKAPAVAAIGSSRVVQLSAEIVGTNDFYNFGMVGADFKDLLGTFYLFDKANKLPETIIFELDPWILNPNEDAIDYRSNKELYNEFLSTCLNIDTGYVPEDDTEIYKALFSPSYLQGNLEYYFRDQSFEKKPDVVKGDLHQQTTEVKMYDGSVLYRPDFINRGQDTINHEATTAAQVFLRMENFTGPDPTLCRIFDTFIKYVQSKHINIVFLLTPYHPDLYSAVTEHAEQYSGFFQVEPWFTSYALQNNIPLYGSYNPYIAGCWDTDFYDGYHIRRESLPHIFPEIKVIYKQQKTGKAGSPWLFGQPLITQETAEKIVCNINELESSKNLIFQQVETVHGQECYIFSLYDTTNTTKLASYAIEQNTGVFHRFDTTQNIWVTDTRYPF